MQREIIDFINGFSDSFVQGLNSTGKNRIEEHIEKYKVKLFFLVISLIIVSTGIFMMILGVSFYIDHIFSMKGLGFVSVGIISLLIGAFAYNRSSH